MSIMHENMKPFHFCTKLNQSILLGKKAKNLRALLEGMKSVPDSSIYHHTHRYLQQHHYLSPEPPNDFAYWVTEVLNNEVLGEKIASIDIIQFHKIVDLKKKFVDIIEEFLQQSHDIGYYSCPEGKEFHFIASKSFVLPLPYVAHNLIEFKLILEKVSIYSLFFHIFEAHLRLGRAENDFSNWFRGLGKVELAEEVSRLDPYTYTLEGLRKRIINLVEKHDEN